MIQIVLSVVGVREAGQTWLWEFNCRCCSWARRGQPRESIIVWCGRYAGSSEHAQGKGSLSLPQTSESVSREKAHFGSHLLWWMADVINLLCLLILWKCMRQFSVLSCCLLVYSKVVVTAPTSRSEIEWCLPSLDLLTMTKLDTANDVDKIASVIHLAICVSVGKYYLEAVLRLERWKQWAV